MYMSRFGMIDLPGYVCVRAQYDNNKKRECLQNNKSKSEKKRIIHQIKRLRILRIYI